MGMFRRIGSGAAPSENANQLQALHGRAHTKYSLTAELQQHC